MKIYNFKILTMTELDITNGGNCDCKCTVPQDALEPGMQQPVQRPPVSIGAASNARKCRRLCREQWGVFHSCN